MIVEAESTPPSENEVIFDQIGKNKEHLKLPFCLSDSLLAPARRCTLPSR
jgi:hypothetical protein